jgi:cytochrome c oxidase assembly protein subunit 15
MPRTLFRGLTLASFLACYVTIIVGGTVIASGSGLGCPSWPLCGSELWPASFSGAAAVEFSHRLAAFILAVLVAATALAAFLTERPRPALQRLAYSSLAVVVLEAVLGGVVVDSSLTVAIVLVHFAIATVLFALLLLLAALANLPALPKRWMEWARYAVREHPIANGGEGSPGAPAPTTNVAEGSLPARDGP